MPATVVKVNISKKSPQGKSVADRMVYALKPYKVRFVEGREADEQVIEVVMRVPGGGEDAILFFNDDGTLAHCSLEYLNRAYEFVGTLEEGEKVSLTFVG